MENMIVLPKLDETLRLPRFIEAVLPEFRKAQSFSIKGQYTHPDYANDWVMAIRVEARRLGNAGFEFLQGIYDQRPVNRTTLVVHMCDLLMDDLENDEQSLQDFEETVRLLRDHIEATYGWVDVRDTSLLSVNRNGFQQKRAPDLPEMRDVVALPPQLPE